MEKYEQLSSVSQAALLVIVTLSSVAFVIAVAIVIQGLFKGQSLKDVYGTEETYDDFDL